MGWKNIILKDFSEFPDVFVEAQPCVIDLVGSINKSANETQFVGIRYKAEIISHQSTSPTLSCEFNTFIIKDFIFLQSRS